MRETGRRQPDHRRAISVAAILMFVGTGSAVLSKSLQHYFEGGALADRTLIIALLLNVPLILFGFRLQQHRRADALGRYRDVFGEEGRS